MTSPVEVELKLELPAAALRQFRKLAWIRALAGSAKRSTPVSVYFDTDKQKLRRRGITLRVRRSGDRYIQTRRPDIQASSRATSGRVKSPTASPTWRRRAAPPSTIC